MSKYQMKCDDINSYSITNTVTEDVIVFDLFKSDAEIISSLLNEQDAQIIKLKKEKSYLIRDKNDLQMIKKIVDKTDRYNNVEVRSAFDRIQEILLND